jgi:hypothetical protein
LISPPLYSSLKFSVRLEWQNSAERWPYTEFCGIFMPWNGNVWPNYWKVGDIILGVERTKTKDGRFDDFSFFLNYYRAQHTDWHIRRLSPQAKKKVCSKMGRIYLEHFGGLRLFSCGNCDTFLTNRDELVSTRFTGSTGRAFLFKKVVNLSHRYLLFRNPFSKALYYVMDLYIFFSIYCDSILVSLQNVWCWQDDTGSEMFSVKTAMIS